MAICSYCGEDRKLTNEHIWSDTLLELYVKDAPLTFDHARARIHAGDPMVKDLCGPCNNALSPADSAIRCFCVRYLLGRFEPWADISLVDPDLERWALKTASNMERSLGVPTSWWKAYVPYMKGGSPEGGRVDLLLAPWKDLTPPALKPLGGAAALGVTLLAARTLDLSQLTSVDPDAAQGAIETAWGLKVNNGVFGLIVWKPAHAPDLRAALVDEARSYGWLDSKRDRRISRFPFNHLSCVLYSTLCSPDVIPRAQWGSTGGSNDPVPPNPRPG